MEPDRKPNFIFILIDDLGWRDITCYGSTFYETPVIDKLAAEGMMFTDAYASCPVCSPTRASILTGKYPATLGLTDYIGAFAQGRLLAAPYLDHLPLEETTIAKVLKNAGYRTYHVGKWHLGNEPYWPEHHGFEVNVGGCGWGNPKHGYFSPYGNPRLSEGPRGEYLTDRLTDEAIKLVMTNGDDPFFLYMSHYAVHMPIQVPKQYSKKYKRKAKATGLNRVKTFETGEHFPIISKRRMRVKRRLVQSDPAYAGMIENLDQNIGRLLRSVDEVGKTRDTIVVFTSDNGGVATYSRPPTTNKPLSEGKGWMYEGGTRVNLIVKWPGHVRPGTVCSTPVTSTDFYPTMLEAAGLPSMPEQHKDGASLIPLLEGQAAFPNRPLFWHFPHYSNLGSKPAASIRDGRFKLIEFFEDRRVELYDLEDDIKEGHDLALVDPQKVQQLQSALHKWLDDINAKFPTPNPNWKLQWDRKSSWKRHFDAVLD